jgi:hypothetical protein
MATRTGLAVVLGAVVVAGGGVWSYANRSEATPSAASTRGGTTYTGTLIGSDGATMSFQLTGSAKAGSVDGQLLNGRVTDTTVLVGLPRDTRGMSGTPVSLIAASDVNRDGSYDLIQVLAQTR